MQLGMNCNVTDGTGGRTGQAGENNWPPLPSSITLYGHTYTISLVDDLANAQNEFGNVNYYRQRIEIDASSVLCVQWRVLVHEVLHIINERMFIDLEEADIHRLDTGLFEFMTQVGVRV